MDKDSNFAAKFLDKYFRKNGKILNVTVLKDFLLIVDYFFMSINAIWDSGGVRGGNWGQLQIF